MVTECRASRGGTQHVAGVYGIKQEMTCALRWTDGGDRDYFLVRGVCEKGGKKEGGGEQETKGYRGGAAPKRGTGESQDEDKDGSAG